MNIKSTLATAVLLGSALMFSAPAFSAEPAAQPKPAAPAAAAPAAKPAAGGAAAAVVPAECAKLTDMKAKDDCVKKAQAAAGGPSGTTTGSTTKQ